MIWSPLTVALAVSAAAPWLAPLPPLARPIMTAVRTPGSLVIDGKLTEGAWTAASPRQDFTQFYPDEASAPTEPTVVRVLYDDEALYVGIDCLQRLTPVTAQLTRRDGSAPTDRVTVDISSRADGVTAFHFGVSAAGVLEDGIYFNDSDYSSDWDENWQGAASVRPDGWSVEVRIPFRILRFDAAKAQVWGLQVQRYTEKRHEWDLWAWRPRSAPGVVSTFGVLEGLASIPPPRAVEVRLSQLLKLRFRDAEARGPFAESSDWSWSLQLDGKVHPTQGSTLDFTVNPDFGQVEADPVVLNLSTTELFFPEKRAFFLEGQESWVTPRQILYTRRIGARPVAPVVDTTALDPATPDSPPRETLVDSVGPSRIWAAAKLVAGATPRNSIALMSALTGENTVLVRRADTMANVSRPADPLALFNVLRAKHRFGFGGDVGLLATATNRFERPADYAASGFRCPSVGPGVPSGMPPTSRCTNDAYVAAVDGRWRSPSATYVLTGQLVGSMLVNGPPRSQRDGIAIVPERPAFGGSVTAAKRGGVHWLATLVEDVSGSQLDYNDLGYLARKNDSLTYADLTYRTLDRWWATTDTATTIAVSHRQALDGIRLEDHLRLSFYATFVNFWAASLNVYYHAPHFDDRETQDGTALERAGLAGAELWVGSDSRRLFTGAVWGQVWKIANGSQVQGSASLVVRPSSRLDLELAPAAFYAAGEPRFVEKNATLPLYTFARQRAANVSVTLRATAALLPTLTLQFYGQLFLATKRFSDPTEFMVPNGGAFRAEIALSDLQPRAGVWIAPDSQQTVLNVNTVLRWEYRLGSILYLVYTRSQNPNISISSGQAPRLDASVLSGNRASTDTLMLKASFWWG
ncbi:MAG: DUF5916 domain-containing protein [Verrucomicrobiota bacterium]